jgi:hypothetical protein
MAKRKSDNFVILSDYVLRRMAHILGPASAAHKALADCEAKRADGQDAVVGSAGNMFVVCSRKFAEMRQDA